MRLEWTPEMNEALPLLQTFREHGHIAVIVGGAVRDAVLGLPVNDIDIATSALPGETMERFPRCIATGLQHGTVTVIYRDTPYEVTTFRTESKYENHRKPAEVTFVSSLDDDLLRRDFTMNAMAISGDGELYDPYGGQSDLARSVLRCVGEADDRFQEDALRMVRAVRFLGAYSLKPALSTWRALKRHAPLLRFVAMERVFAELDKMMGSSYPERSMVWLAASGLIHHVKEPLTDHNLNLVNGEPLVDLKRLADKDERWAALLIALKFDEHDVNRLTSSLRLPNKRAAFLQSMLLLHSKMSTVKSGTLSEEQRERAWVETVVQFGDGHAAHWLNIVSALPDLAEQWSSETIEKLREEISAMPVKSLKELNVGGADIQRRLQRPPGPWLAALLQVLLIEAALGRVPNLKEPLLELAEIWNDEGQNDE